MAIRILQYGTTLVLARLLIAEDFGIWAILLLFTQLAYVLFDFGFSSALIQHKNLDEQHYNTTFLIYLLSALIYTLLVWLFAGVFAQFFKHAELKPALERLTIIFILYAFNAIPRIRLQREMRFKRFSLIQISGVSVNSVVTLSLALTGHGFWSFVYGIIAEQLVLTILFNVLAWTPVRLSFDKKAFHELWGYGVSVLGTRLVGYLNTNIPSFLIGKLLGLDALGYYNIAYQLVEFPVQRISKNVLRVMFPAFSRLQGNLAEYRQLYRQVVFYLGTVLTPMFIGLAMVAPYLVPVLYGEKWIPVIVPLQLLALAGFSRSVWTTISVIFLSKGQPRKELRINLMLSVFLLPAVYFTASLGLNMVVLSVSVLLFVFVLIGQYLAFRLIDISWWSVIRKFGPSLLGSILFVAAYQTALYLGLGHLADVYVLIYGILLSILIYVVFIFWTDAHFIHRLRNVLKGNPDAKKD